MEYFMRFIGLIGGTQICAREGKNPAQAVAVFQQKFDDFSLKVSPFCKKMSLE